MSATQTQPLELIVSVKGEIIKSNFDEFEAYALEQLAGINTDLNTDEDFGQAAADEKALKVAESKFKEVENQILAEMDAVSDLINRTRGLGEKYSAKRLALGKELRNRKAAIIAGIKADAIASISIKHPKAELRIAEAMKNKRTLASLKQHAEAEAVRIEAEVQRAREVVEQFIDDHGRDIVYDEHKLLVMDCELVAAELSRRVERKAAALKEAELKAEAEKARQEAEAQRRAEWERREAEAKAENTPATVEASPEEVRTTEPSAFVPEEREPTVEEEKAEGLQILRTSLIAFREWRSGIQHGENREAFGKCAMAINEAFTELKGGGK